MKSYLLKTFIVTVFSALIIYIYYIVDPRHSLGFSWTGAYLGVLLFVYLCYKAFYIGLWYDKIILTPAKIIYWFLLHLFILCCFFFIINGLWASSAMILFIKIVSFVLIPFLFFFIFHWFWKKILSYHKSFISETPIFKTLTSVWFWFFSFLFFLTIAWWLALYNSSIVLFLLWIFAFVWYKQITESIRFLVWYRIEFKNHDFASDKISEKYNPFLLSTEFLFVIITGLLSINFISVFRPFPIGWDDLGAYMNYPKLISEAGELLSLGQMFSWQLFTGIWFLFESQTLAFFLNSFTAVLAGVGIYLFLYSFISENTKKKTYINIPLLWSTIFLAMPMVIFQVAKDMKLDIGLFFVTLIPLYILYYLSLKKDIPLKSQLLYIGVAGLLAWLCFSIKVTSLLFIVAFIWTLSFSYLSIAWLLWYLAIFFAIFTKLKLWDMMWIVYPKENIFFINTFSLTSLVIWCALIVFSSFPKKIDQSILLFKKVFIFILSFILALSPWFVKNISEVGISEVSSIKQIISWKTDKLQVNYLHIYSEVELENIEKLEASERMKDSGTSDNEDFWRYFGYETGINNYIKLPWNLSMQLNQGWEFTDITYIFLAFLPALLLFLPYRFRYIWYTIVWVLILELCLFLNLPSQKVFTDIFAQINLPGWYGVILWVMLLPLLFFKYTLKKNKYLTKLFLINLVFTVVYVFLWNISSLGVVWYGIMMYLSFIMMIAICFYYISCHDSDENNYPALFSSILIFWLISIYFIYSNIPHMMQNLVQAWYPQYKLGAANEDESIFLAHPDYFPILFHLNIADKHKQNFFEDYKTQTSDALTQWSYNPQFSQILTQIKDVSWLGSYFKNIPQTPLKNTSEANLKKQIQNLNRDMSHAILYPSDEQKNQAWIYRIWTFLKYFISENNKRLLEDNLLTKFDRYIYDNDVDVTVDRMKSLGLDYLLVDLNAATIDKDPRRLLTQRYENLLKTFTSHKATLVETDSICLKIALEKYNKDENMADYLTLAGANHASYSDKWILTQSPSNKMIACLSFVLDVLEQDKINAENYNYLLWLDRQFEANNIDMSNKKEAMTFLQRFITSGSKVLFKIQ